MYSICNVPIPLCTVTLVLTRIHMCDLCIYANLHMKTKENKCVSFLVLSCIKTFIIWLPITKWKGQRRCEWGISVGSIANYL